MTDREKLIELLKDSLRESGEYCGENTCQKCQYDKYGDDCGFAIRADYLIANGVTFATDNNVGDKWIPVTERLPGKMCQCVCRYVFGENGEYPFFQVLWYFANLEEPHFQHEGSMGLRVTHWMPLPEPPKGE